MIRGRVLLAALVLAIMAVPASAAPQRSCLFERQISPEGTFSVNLPILIARDGSRATVAVSTTGQEYRAKARLGRNAIDVTFKTPVSREVITVGAGGEAVWQIEFTDGRTSMGYVGRCGNEQG